MSTTTPASEPALGWTPPRRRRLNMFMAALAGVALAAVLFTTQPWYAWSTSGPASCTPSATANRVTVRTPTTAVKVTGVYAAGCISGTELAAAFAPATGTTRDQLTAMSDLGPQPVPDTMFGLPRTTVLLLGSLVLGIFGLWSRNGFLSGLGFVVMYYAHRDLGSLSSLMLGGTGGSLTSSLPALDHFGEALLVGWILLVTATVFVVRVNADQRAFDTIVAAREGVPGPLSPLDHVTSFVGGLAAKLVDSVVEHRAGEAAKSENPTTRTPR